MKKKCMAVGGTAKKPATMEEQLAGIRGKVRPGYQAGGIAGIDYPRSFSGQFPVRQPLGAGLGATAIQSGEYAVNAPGSIPQSLGLLGAPDYSTGPRQGGFVYEDGTPRPSQNGNEETQSAKRGQLSEQIDMGQAMAGLSNTERYKLGGSGTSAEVSEINQRNDILKTLNASLQPTQQIQVGRAPRPGIVGGIEEQLIKRGRNGFADGGIIDKLIRAVGRVLPDSNGQKYEPGIQSRAAEDPARHGRAEALNPRTQTASSETPPAGGFQEEAERRRKQMKEAVNYEDGGMVESEDEDESEDKNKCSIEISIDIPVGDKRVNVKNSGAADYACGGKVKKRGMAGGGMVRFAGKGGPRDDQIPVKVAGEEINVSNGENAVILPAKTAANPAALYAIGGIIQATNDGRKPKMGMEKGGKYKDGAYPYDDKPPPTAQQVYAGASPAGMVQAITPDSWRTARVVAPAGSVGGGMSSSGTDPRDIPAGGTITNLAPALQQIHNFAKPAYDLSPSMRALGTAGSAVGNVFADSAEAQRQGTTYGAAREARIASEGKANAAPYSNEGRPSAMDNYALTPVYGPTPKGIAAGVAQPSGTVVSDGMTTAQMGRGFDPTKLQIAPGYGMMTNAAGKTIAAGNAEYVGADGQPTSRWTDTQRYKDAIAKNERDKLMLAEMQAQRLGADPMAVQAASQGITGGVLGNKTKQAELQRLEQIQSLVARASAETDPAKQKQYLDSAMALQGKDNKRERNLKTVDLGASTVDDGMGGTKVVPRGQALYDADNNRVVQLGSGGAPQTSQQAESIKAQLAAGKISREKAIEELRKIGFQ